MVIKGGSRGGGGNLAAHLLRTDTNERAEVVELKGVAADRLPEALAEMEAVATGTRCRKSLYHASINTGPGELLTLEQKAAAVARLELALGLEGHARAVVEHRKEGRDHLHVVWSRIDAETMKAVHDGHNYRRHEAVARELEQEFGHNRVQGAHVGRDTPEGDRKPRPPRTPSPGDVQQATRTKREIGDVAAELTGLWQRTDSGTAFVAAMREAGYELARGDRRGFCVVDQLGGVHSLARRIEGVKTKEVNARLAGIDLAGLPSADQARALQRDRQQAQESVTRPEHEHPANRLRSELMRPEVDRQARAERIAEAAEGAEAQRQQIRRDLEAHRQEQAGKARPAPETVRQEAERPAAPIIPVPRSERAYAPAEGPGGPDLAQQRADSAEYRRGQEEARDRSRPVRPVQPTAGKEAARAAGKAAGLAGNAAGQGVRAGTGLFGGLLGILAKGFEALTSRPTTGAAPERDREPPPRRPEARPTPAPQRPAPEPEKARPVRPPSLMDEMEKEIRAKAAAAPRPTPEQERDRDRDRSRFETRPISRLAGVLGSYVGWAIETRKRLLAFAIRTGEDVSEQLRELDDTIYFSGHAIRPRQGEGWAR